MNISEQWLRIWINPAISREKLAEQLILAGLEVESITPVGDDAIFELSITPNRGDCLSILGIAREIAAINDMSLKIPLLQRGEPTITDTFPVSIQPDAEQACPRYIGRIVRNINPAAATPEWLKARLISGGIEPKMPVVDVLNYVMLELGQPMHAFDLDVLSGDIQIRMAKSNEQIQLLNNQTVKLQPDTLVIADNREAQAIAGVMGGLKSAVQQTTRNIFLESAFFEPSAIAGRARRYGLHTDSSFRFERGVDPELQERAIDYATKLLLEIVGGECGPLIHKTTKHLPVISPIELKINRVEDLLGIKIPEDKIVAMLTSLGMQTTVMPSSFAEAPADKAQALSAEALAKADGIQSYKITPPSYRFDIRIPEDLIEEIARLYGYDKIPSSPIVMGGVARHNLSEDGQLSRFRQLLVDRGYREAITYSFVDPKLQQALHPESDSFALVNPISPELSVMRVGLWSGLLTALQYNYNRQQSRIRLFESGLSFHPEKDQQLPILSGVIVGSAYPEQWGTPTRSADFFDLKSDVEALIAITGNATELVFEPKARHAFHPQQACCIKKQGREIGWLGQLNPAIQQTLGISEPIYLFELILEEITQMVKPSFKPLPKFPSVRRDISILVDKTVSAAQITQAIQAQQLEQVLFFDVYEGKGVPSHQKSLALGLTFQHPTRTLTDEEVNVQMAHIIAILEKDLNATLRS